MGKFNRIKNALSNTDIEREEVTDAQDKLEKFRRSDDKPLRKVCTHALNEWCTCDNGR